MISPLNILIVLISAAVIFLCGYLFAMARGIGKEIEVAELEIQKQKIELVMLIFKGLKK
jgi:hypothetical protein